MYLSIILLPLISSLTCGLFGRLLGQRGTQLFSTSLILISALLASILLYEIGLSTAPCYITLAPWINIGHLSISWGFLLDSLTSIMLIVVTFISFLVHLYSIGYMEKDPHAPRFMCYLSLFTFFMLILVTANNFLQLFIGWEGVGVCSYLLINFWFTRLQANKAALKAMIVNRIGDLGYVLAIFAIYLTFKSLDFETVFALAPFMKDETFNLLTFEINKITFICLMLFVGAIGKSAQFGLHIWLPDAMEGPTPVSALIHAATMVTAGVFLILRASPLFELSPLSLNVVTIIGALTAFFAATTGLLQNDLKKVIAYSTCSQLGYMVFACGLSHYSVSLFHLMNHAFFKALLFLSAGAVIHALNDEQDLRKMGGLIKVIPFTYIMILIGSLSLMGFPFLTGYYSKDLILEVAYSKYTLSSYFAYWLGTLSAFFTAFYSFRLILLGFFNEANTNKTLIKNAHESPMTITIPLIVLAICSIFLGYITKDLLIGLGTNFWNNALIENIDTLVTIDSEFLSSFVKLIPVIFSLVGALLAIVLYNSFSIILIELKLKYRGLYSFLNKKWYFDTIYNEFITQKVLTLGYNITFKTIDRGILELLGPYGLVKVISKLSNSVSTIQTGLLYHYAFLMLIGLIAYLSLLVMDITINMKYLIMGFIAFLTLIL